MTIQQVDFPLSYENIFFQKNLNQATLDQIYEWILQIQTT